MTQLGDPAAVERKRGVSAQVCATPMVVPGAPAEWRPSKGGLRRESQHEDAENGARGMAAFEGRIETSGAGFGSPLSELAERRPSKGGLR